MTRFPDELRIEVVRGNNGPEESACGIAEMPTGIEFSVMAVVFTCLRPGRA